MVQCPAVLCPVAQWDLLLPELSRVVGLQELQVVWIIVLMPVVAMRLMELLNQRTVLPSFVDGNILMRMVSSFARFSNI
jgi:hypothetical protein